MTATLGRAVGALLVLLLLARCAAAAPVASPSSSPSPAPVASPSAAPSPSPTAKAKKSPWSVDGDYRLLVQGWQWFRAPGNYENQYTFAGNRLRARLNYKNANVQGMAEVQDVQMLGLPTHAIGPAPIGQMGGGASFEGDILRTTVNAAGLRQAWLRLGDVKAVSGQVGRFEFLSEMEVTTGDPTLDALKRARLKERLIGPTLFSDFGRTFDGVRMDVDSATDHLTGFVAHPTQGGFEPHFGTEISQILISDVSWTLKRSKRLPDSEGELFWIHYDDTRDVPFVDNRPTALRGRVNAQGGIHIDTYGMHFLSKLGNDGDALVWYAHQSGRWGTLTHNADAFSAELGYRFPKTAWSPWLRAGYTWYSGDDNPRDRIHGTFFAPLPTNRQFARFPLYTFANLGDLFASLQLQPARQTAIRMDLHGVKLANSNDLWYTGSGPTQAAGSIFGYAGRTSSGKTGLATVGDLSIEQKFDDNNSLMLYYGHAWGGAVTHGIFPGSDASLWLLQYDLKLP